MSSSSIGGTDGHYCFQFHPMLVRPASTYPLHNVVAIIELSALRDERMTAAELKWYSDIKVELRKYDIAVGDLPKFVKAVNGLRQYGYDVGKIIREFSESQSRETRRKMLEDSVRMLQNESNYLGQRCSSLENMVNSQEQIISVELQIIF